MKTVPFPWTFSGAIAAGGECASLRPFTPPEAIRKILECLGLPSRPPPLARPERIDDLYYA